jgi:hypothetical protein
MPTTIVSVAIDVDHWSARLSRLPRAALTPLSVDGMIVAASTALLADSR